MTDITGALSKIEAVLKKHEMYEDDNDTWFDNDIKESLELIQAIRDAVPDRLPAIIKARQAQHTHSVFMDGSHTMPTGGEERLTYTAQILHQITKESE